MTITQTLTHINQTGSAQNSISTDVHNIPISDTNIVCATFILFMILFGIYKLVTGYINKSCLGCKRLKHCENEIKKIKHTLKIEEHVSPDILKDILKQVNELKQKVISNGTMD